MICIFWDDLTKTKQEEILVVFGENCNFDIFPIAEIPTDEDCENGGEPYGK